MVQKAGSELAHKVSTSLVSSFAWCVQGTSRSHTGATVTWAVVPLHSNGTQSLPCESSFLMVIFSCLVLVKTLSKVENKQLKEKKITFSLASAQQREAVAVGGCKHAGPLGVGFVVELDGLKRSFLWL